MIEEVKKLAGYIKIKFANDSSGHDWWHTHRIYNLSKRIAVSERADLYIVELASLLHDVADWKFNRGNEQIGAKLASELLQQLSVNQEVISSVADIILNISFKGANAENKIRTLEGQCVQDADRLDAIGAIGIARCFAFGGWKGNPIYNPEISVNVNQTVEQYKQAKSPQINHFYEKLLLLKDRMNTKTGKRIAQKRHEFMKQYLDRFFKEWEGEI